MPEVSNPGATKVRHDRRSSLICFFYEFAIASTSKLYAIVNYWPVWRNKMRSDTYRNLRSGDVIVRFCLRMIIFTAFAAFAGSGFFRSLAALLWMSTILSAIFAAIRRELPLDAVLNYWDEAAVYIALCCLLSIN